MFTCLSHDIVAHETTHAILDGMHRHFGDPTNPDVLAFHEAFADIVALLQHFTMREILEDQIAHSRGDLESETMLGSLAVQFGRATGRRGAMRDAIGTFDDQGVWHRLKPDPSDYTKITEPHRRGSLLVAAVFDAFLMIYKRRTADLIASTPAAPVFCSRAPSIPIWCGAWRTKPPSPRRTFCTHASALSTTCRRSTSPSANTCAASSPPISIWCRTIRSATASHLSKRSAAAASTPPTSIRSRSIRCAGRAWNRRRRQPLSFHPRALKRFADECLYIDDRRKLFNRTRSERARMHEQIKKALGADKELARPFGIDPSLNFEVHELRRAERTGPDGRPHPQVIVAITQQRPIDVPNSKGGYQFLGGSTLIIDLKKPELKYAIRKRIDQKDREQATAAFVSHALADPVTALLFDQDRLDRFAALHSLAGV